MKFHLHPRADVELTEAVRNYELQQSGLGVAFAREVYNSIQRACEYPAAWTRISTHTRRCLVNRFPYAVIFQEDKGALRIIAIAHLHRRPDYWKVRS